MEVGILIIFIYSMHSELAGNENLLPQLVLF